MQKIIIFGNSGAGKSTLAKQLVNDFQLAHCDLDNFAWQKTLATSLPQRKKISDSLIDINDFINANNQWVIEGCYADLLNEVTQHSTQIIFINPGVETCIKHCKNRPWEPHKYASKEAQDENLNMLIEWIKQYDSRDDIFSLKAHRELFDDFKGNKVEYTNGDLIY